MTQFGSVSDVVTVFKRRFLLIAAIAIIGCVASVYFALQLPRVYETNALVQLEDAQVIDARTGQTDAAHKLQLIEQRMMARDNLIEIIEDYNLYAGTDLSLALKVVELRRSARITQITDASQPWMPNANPTGLIINVTMQDPQEAADVANELLARIVDQGTSRQAEIARETLAFFQTEETRLLQDVSSLERALAEFKLANSESLPAAVAATRTQLATFVDADLEIERQIIALQSDTRRVRGNIENDIALLESQRKAVQVRMSAAEAAIENAPQVEQELALLERELTFVQEQYAEVARRLAQAETSATLQSRQQTERFEVLETALVPEFPVSRSRKKTAIMGGVISVILAIGAALTLEMMNPTIRSAAQLERALGMQAVISIPNIATSVERRRRSLVIIGAMATALVSIPTAWGALREKIESLGFFRKGDGQIARP